MTTLQVRLAGAISHYSGLQTPATLPVEGHVSSADDLLRWYPSLLRRQRITDNIPPLRGTQLTGVCLLCVDAQVDAGRPRPVANELTVAAL